jgi:hypothetical protein
MVCAGFLRVNTEKYIVLSKVTPTLRREDTLLLLDCSVKSGSLQFWRSETRRLLLAFSERDHHRHVLRVIHIASSRQEMRVNGPRRTISANSGNYSTRVCKGPDQSANEFET